MTSAQALANGVSDDSPRRGRLHDYENASPHLLKMPLEVRLLIYERAVSVPKPIRPAQVKQRSNKFFWGTQITSSYTATELPHSVRFGARMQPATAATLTACQLASTCRQIRDELDAWRVFYRVNSFEFTDVRLMVKFLVAIKPERRHAIRKIVIKGTEVQRPIISPYRPRVDKIKPAHILAILREMKDLEVLRFEATPWFLSRAVDEFSHKLSADYKGYLKRLVRDLQSDRDDAMELWSVPQFRLMLTLPRRMQADLTDTDAAPSESLSLLLARRPRLARLIFKVRRNMMARRAQIREAEGRDGENRKDITRAALQDAFAAAEIDFVGEDRTAQSLFQSTVTPVSRRTRSRCKRGDHNTDLGGVIGSAETKKYDAEGLLTTPIQDITGVRQGPSGTVECEVAGPRMIATWEPIHTVLTVNGETRLRKLYRRLLRRDTHAELEDELDRLQQIPPPKTITALCDAFMQHEKQDRPSVWMTYVRAWKDLQKRLDHLLAEVEQEAADTSEGVENTKKARAVTV